MAELLFFGKSFPLALYFLGLILPLFSYNLRDLGVSKTRILSNNVGLVMLSIEYKC